MMKNSYLLKLQKKCNLTDDFINIINSLISKLLEFGYISKLDVNKLYKKLYTNIDVVLTGSKDLLDYKTGYYDALKKELYIKDITNIQAVYLRLLYVLCTKQVNDKHFLIGYSEAKLAKENYKPKHYNFGFNRAVLSNLTCRLLYTLPQSLSLMPTYRSYQNNFLGYNIIADNDIYFLEGKLLRQICFIYRISEESLYANLFSYKGSSFLKKHDLDKIYKLFDIISRTYSNYNKLCYFNRLLNDNFLKIKQNSIKKKIDITELYKRENELIRTVKTVLNKINHNKHDEKDLDNNYTALELSLTEKLDELETDILTEITDIQTLFITKVIEEKENFAKDTYVIYLKKLEDMLILKSSKIHIEIFNSITYDVIHSNESSCTNLVSKLKYYLADYMLGKEKYIRLYEDLTFRIVQGINENSDDICVMINSGLLNELVYIKDLCKDPKENLGHNNVEFLNSKNLKHIINTNIKETESIEKLFTSLRTTYLEFNNISINDVYIYDAKTEKLLLIIANNIEYIVLIDDSNMDDIKFELLNLSEKYTLINNNENLPMLYTNKPSLFNILNIFSLKSPKRFKKNML